MTDILGFSRADGRTGIRNCVIVVYTVECAHMVANSIAAPYAMDSVQVIGFGGCYPNKYAQLMMEQLFTHPNTAAVLLVSLGCEGFDRERLADIVGASGRPVESLVIQESGGTRGTVDAGRRWVADVVRSLAQSPRKVIAPSDLVVGTICGGSDGTFGSV